MSRKAPPPKKRHTKPCKFFQVDRCPYPADVCNFAHVIVLPSDRDSSIRRYYPAGYYAQDALRRYRYGSRGPLLKPLDIPTSAQSLVQEDARSSEKAYLCGGTLISPDVLPSRNWSSSAFSPKTAPDSPQLASLESITTSSASVSTSDEAVIVTDPQYHEHPHSHQSQVYVEDDSPVIHVPPFSPFHQLTFNGPHTPLYSHEYSYVSRRLSDNFKPHNSMRASVKQKILKYKTKPCKFFTTERGCPNGSSCTFIHDEAQLQASSPAKEENSEEQNCRKNYFPVPWRVIGGGVRVGIKTEDLDLYSTAPKTLPIDPDSNPGHGAPPTRVISRKRSNSNPPTLSPHSHQFKVEHLFSAESPGVL